MNRYEFENLISEYLDGSISFNKQKEFEQYMEQHNRDVMPLFAITPKGRLQIFTVDNSPKVASGWTIISLVDS